MTTEFPLPPSLGLVARLSLPQLCGQLLVVGFEGTTLPASLAEALQAGLRGGVILFKRNLPDLQTAWRLCREIIAAYPEGVPPFIAIDQEGGRVGRLPPPFLTLPPMRQLGKIGDPALTHRAGAEVARQLSALGISCNFAPVLDIDTNERNPIIGDRSFSSDPNVVAQHAIAFALAMQDQGVIACGKHFPGHGDTSLDSHLALPTVSRDHRHLMETEILPFREAIRAGLASIMTAHVSYPALDPAVNCATLSSRIITDLLRRELAFEGVVFSDDLEMRGVLQDRSLTEAAVDAIRSGCDALLVCKSEARAEEALTGLVCAAETEPLLSTKIMEANVRFQRLRQTYPPRPQPTLDSLNYAVPGPNAAELLAEVERRWAESFPPKAVGAVGAVGAAAPVTVSTSPLQAKPDAQD